jgi:hypothetical protein
MKASRFIMAGLLFAVVATSLPGSAWAIPVFARKYGFSCNMCHSNIPRLNDFGTRYRENGYQLPGRENDEKTILEGPPPIALRTSAGYAYEKYSNVPDAERTSHFMLNGLDILSAGLLGPNIGYMFIYTPEIASSRNVEGQQGNLEMASIVFSNVGTPWLNVRAGRFEPAYVAFSVKRQLSIAPRDIYDYGAPGGVVLSETQTGIELSGYGPGFGRGYRVAYAAGLLNGSETNQSGDEPADFYGRLAWVIGDGEGETAGQRIGVMGYLGSARADSLSWGTSRQSFYRVGVDASLNAGVFNLALQYLLGKDNKELWGYTEDPDFSGGFAELSVMPAVQWVVFARYDMVKTPKQIDEDTSRVTAGARYYFVNNLALHLEYSRATQNAKTGDDPALNTAWARLDFAF